MLASIPTPAIASGKTIPAVGSDVPAKMTAPSTIGATIEPT